MKIQTNNTYHKNNTQSFGWLAKTHNHITKCVLEQIPELTPYKGFIKLGAVMPDIRLQQTSILNDKSHNFFGGIVNSFSITPENASDFYFENLSKAMSFLVRGHERTAMYKFGEALHFLQDMAVPMHTKKECGGLLKVKSHLNWERVACLNNHFLNKLTPQNPNAEPESFYNLFINTHSKTSASQNPFETGARKNWKSMIESSFTTAYQTTYSFLKKVAILQSTPLNERKNKLLTEAIESFKLN